MNGKDTCPAYAHSSPDPSSKDGEPLEDHLRAVSERACRFASQFGSGEWGTLAGLWHDLGKYRPEFQSYLRGERPSGGEHAGLGAVANWQWIRGEG